VGWDDIIEYFGKYSPTTKSFQVASGRSTTFKEYANFCMQLTLLQQNLYVVTKVHGNLSIGGWENRALD
jgi:hypothetical protein